MSRAQFLTLARTGTVMSAVGPSPMIYLISCGTTWAALDSSSARIDQGELLQWTIRMTLRGKHIAKVDIPS